MEAIAVSDISGSEELSRREVVQNGWASWIETSCRVSAESFHNCVCGGDSPLWTVREAGGHGTQELPLREKLDAVADRQQGLQDTDHLPEMARNGGNRIHGFFVFFLIQKEGKLHPGNITPSKVYGSRMFNCKPFLRTSCWVMLSRLLLW